MNTPASSQQLANDSQAKLDRFLVCGLGSVGQYCVAALKEFGVSVIAIDEAPPKNWEIPNLPRLLEDLIIGDCRQTSVLQQAKIGQCRAVLIVTSNERMNIETALEVRELNRQARLVVRSAQENLNQLLAKRLGNFVAFEPTQLPATAFALAALGGEALGFFNLESQWLRVVKHQIQASDRWCNVRLLHELNTHRRSILYHSPNATEIFPSFHQWELDTRVQPGDTLVYVEITDLTASHPHNLANPNQHQIGKLLAVLKNLKEKSFQQHLERLWKRISEEMLERGTRRLSTKTAFILGFLIILGTFLFKLEYSDKIQLKDAFNITLILLLGGFDNVFGSLKVPFPISLGMYLFSIGLTVAGTIFIGVLYAMLTEKVIAARFQLQKRRPPVPQQDHVVVIGLDAVGQQVVTLLQQFQQPVVGISLKSDFDRTILPKMPLIIGQVNEVLAKANINTAKSVIVETNDEMLNLEIGLMVRATNPNCYLAIRTFERRLIDNLPHLLPDAHVLHANALVAEAFAGAAFGENILSLFRVDNQTILVAEYRIETNDTLNELLLSEVAYGYGVVPILYQKSLNYATLMPFDDLRLAVGDRLVVLATIHGLRRIEQGVMSIVSRCYKVTIEKALSSYAAFEGANTIARISGCEISTARELMNNLPGTLRSPLYKHQAQRLVRELNKIQIVARIIPITG